MNNKFYLIATLVVVGVFGYWLVNEQKKDETTPPKIVSADVYNRKQPVGEFSGEKGEKVEVVDAKVEIPIKDLETNVVKYFNVELEGKTIYFMVVKDENGIYRAAANGCEVCYGAMKGFRQEGNRIICNNCGNAFELSTLGITKGGCNPGPISKDIKVNNGNLILTANEIAQVSNLFN